MSNPTTPFSWQMPTATDLVTDLPADFEVFGQAVATSMADLLGGTTGQILSKTTGTDMDFTWINNDQGDITGVTAGNGITVTDPTGPVPTVAINTAVTADLTTAQTLTNKKLSDSTTTIVDVSDATKAIKFDVGGTTAITGTIATAFTTAKTVTIPDTTGTVALTNGVINNTLTTTTGDIIYASAANTPARLGIGSSAQVLTVASGIPSWATPSSGGMTLISTTTLTGTSVTISSIPQTYINLMFQFVTSSSITGYPKLTYNAGGTQLSMTKEANSTAWNNQGSLGYITPQGTAVNATDFNGQMMVYNYFESGFTTMAMSAVYGPSPFQNIVNYGMSQSANPLTSLVIAWSSGGTLSGTVKMYGIK